MKQAHRIKAPAREALEYETQVFYSPVDGNPFAGPPRPELDEAWHHLLRSAKSPPSFEMSELIY